MLKIIRNVLAPLALLVFAGATVSIAQSRSDGSVYSRFGLGERAFYLSSQSQAMGHAGSALGSFRYANLANPAGLADQFFTRVNGGMTVERLVSSETGLDDSILNSGRFNSVHISFPIRTRKTGIGLALEPFTHVNYRIDKSTSVVADPAAGTDVPVLTTFQGNGGLYQLTGAVGQRLTTELSAGLAVSYVFGLLEEAQRTTFNNVRFTDSDISNNTRLSGASATLGLRFQRQGILGLDRPIAMGLSVTLPSTLSGERTLTLEAGSTSDTLTVAGSGNIDLPVRILFGLMFQPATEWTVVADIHHERWSSLSSDFSLPGIGVGNQGAMDRTRAGAGVEYWPGARRPFGPYFVRMAYRMGVYIDESYVSPHPSEQIRSIGVTGGVSVPTGIPGTTIDLNLDVGRRGTTSDGLVRDRYMKFGININFGERWFDRLPLG